MKDILLELKPNHDYLVCVDSDGCVFDNMELKHKECFCPATVNIWNLQSVSRFAREAADYVNLYSRMRGINRFPSIVHTLELCAGRPEVIERGYVLPDLQPLKDWIESTSSLSAGMLEGYLREHSSAPEVLRTAVAWSREADRNVQHIVRNLLPFPHAREALAELSRIADIVVVSGAPSEVLEREWMECGLAQYASAMAGQELGSKAECIRKAMQDRYKPEHVLKIGDAPGDYEAARQNGVLFCPIIPGREPESWRQILYDAAHRLQNGSYRGAYMDSLIEEFFAGLLEEPPWQNA